MLTRKLGILAGIAVVAATSLWGLQALDVPPPDGARDYEADLGAIPIPRATRALLDRYAAERAEIVALVRGRSDAEAQIAAHGIRAPRAYRVLGDAGIETLGNDHPQFERFLDAPSSVSAASGLRPLAEYVRELQRRAPARVDDLFYTIRRIPASVAPLLADYPLALPVLAVVPRAGARVVDRYGARGLQVLLQFTPDSYPAVARLLDQDGPRVFTAYDLLQKTATELGEDTHLSTSFLATYFLEFDAPARFLERSAGLEASLFFFARNLETLAAWRAVHGSDAVQANLMALVDYLKSEVPERRQVAESCLTLPGAFPLFLAGRHDPGPRDALLARAPETGAATLLTSQYDESLWPALMRAAADPRLSGDRALLPLTALADAPAFKQALGRYAKDVDRLLDMLEALGNALLDRGDDDPLNLGAASRTLKMILNDDWADIPDDYLAHDIWWLWDVLPGRDAFRLARLMLKGYMPQLDEALAGGWDALNLVMFATGTGKALVNCTQQVVSAMTAQSFSGLGHALGVIGRELGANVLKGLWAALKRPRNYLRLAVGGAYFAWDAILRYTSIAVPNKARLLQVNTERLTPAAKTLMLSLGRDLLLEALWRPEFDAKGKPVAPKDVPADIWATLAPEGRMRLALDKLDDHLKYQVLRLLERNDRRRRVLQALELVLPQVPGLGKDRRGADRRGENGRRGGDLPGATDPRAEPRAEPRREGERESKDVRAPAGSLTDPSGTRTIALTAPRFRPLSPGEHLSAITRRRLVVPRTSAGWHTLLSSPAMVPYALDAVLDAIPAGLTRR